MGEDDGGGIRPQSRFHDLTRTNVRLRQRSAEKLLDGNHAVLCIESDAD
jgi:hypothetical protein